MKKVGNIAESIMSLISKNTVKETRVELYTSNKPSNKRKKVKLARKANLQRIKNHK